LKQNKKGTSLIQCTKLKNVHFFLVFLASRKFDEIKKFSKTSAKNENEKESRTS